MIQLGDKVKDTVTGFIGIAVARVDWIQGCVRFGVQSDKLKDGLPAETQYFDEPQLVLVRSGVVPRAGLKSPRTGGPIPTPRRHSNPTR